MAAVTITNLGKNLLRNALDGVGSLPKINYVAVGTGSTAPAATDTQLGAEVFRKAVTSYANGANPGEGLILMSLGPQDIPGTTIQEVGWFVGGSPTSGSGTMVARVLYNHAHTALENINMQLDNTVG